MADGATCACTLSRFEVMLCFNASSLIVSYECSDHQLAIYMHAFG